jgi:short subunit dehydrogenase-like uncharacterized protein
MSDEVLILGATGRTGRGIAKLLDAAGVPLALYGRDERRLTEAAAGLTHAPRLVTGALGDLESLLAADAPAVVMNTVGPFASTAVRVIDALGPGTHYADLSNEYRSFQAVFDLHDRAVSLGQTLVAGAGFGVISTEAPLLAVCADEPVPSTVRVDALPSVALEAEPIGAALAGSIVDSLPFGRRQFRDGELISRALDDTPLALTTPDGDQVASVNFTSGDLLTARRISGAPNVVAGSSEVPGGAVLRYALPPFFLLTRSDRLRGLMARQMAKAKMKAKPRPRENSYGHASASFANATTREAWLRIPGDAMDFTCVAAAAVATRLAQGEGRPGAFTPCALFGPELAVAAGGELILSWSSRTS